MRNELDEALCRDFPKIFANRYGDMQTTAMCWGFECESGWEPLIRRLCEKLQRLSDYEGHQVVASQIKEKFGTLSFYVQSATEIQYDVISQAEDLSRQKCEVCGKYAETRSKGYWLKTVCTEHAAEHGYWLYECEAEKLGLEKGTYLSHEELKKSTHKGG